MADSVSPEVAVTADQHAAYANGTEALVVTVRRILVQIEDSEQRVHVRIRQALRSFVAAYERHEDLTVHMAEIQHHLDLAAAELALKKGKLTEAKALALLGYHRHNGRIEFILCLARIASASEKYDEALAHYRDAHSRGAEDPVIYHDLAMLYQKMGQFAEADRIWLAGFPNGSIHRKSYTGAGKPLRVLVITSPLTGNVRYRLFLKKHQAEITQLCADSYVGQHMQLPEHDIIFSSIGDADLCTHSLPRAQQLVRLSNAPVLNHPDAVLLTTRDQISQRLATVDGVITSKIQRFSKAELMSPNGAALLEQHGYAYPLLLRSPGFNNGSHFEMVENATKLAETAAKLPTEEIFALSYLDTKADDGSVRKFRVLRINGVLYPIHLAIARSWKIHYHSSDMAENDIYRMEERRFLNDMDTYLGPPVIGALHRVFDMLGLDYAGIDFSIDRDGRLAVYEANATMAIIAPNNDERWNYRREAIDKALSAGAQMFFDRALTSVSKAA